LSRLFASSERYWIFQAAEIRLRDRGNKAGTALFGRDGF
jgi:hypothetical protein